MYKRLTKRYEDKYVVDPLIYIEPNSILSKVTNRLADLEDRIENGTLRFIPCKVGDTVYMPWGYDGVFGVANLTVTKISIDEKCVDTNLESDVFGYLRKYDFGVFEFTDFGKKIFLTKPEAEQKLKELGGEV